MFSRGKTTPPDTAPKQGGVTKDSATAAKPAGLETGERKPGASPSASKATETAKPPASMLSSDLHIVGNIRTSGDILIEGKVDGDIHAHLLTIGEKATIKGEVIADDVIVHGRITGRLSGLKVRLAGTAHVEGDIIHKTIAIENGAHFEGVVQRKDDPLAGSSRADQPASASAPPSPAAGQGGAGAAPKPQAAMAAGSGERQS